LKIGFVSLGCPKNLVDSEVMMGLVVTRGHELTPRPEEAEAIVVNTCSFIGPAKQESVDAILEMAEFKRTGRAKRLVVTGCLVERFRREIREQVPEVDAVLGTNEVEEIAAACEGKPLSGEGVGPYLYHDGTPRVRATPSYYAYVKIAEGCDHPCTFCVIPLLRGSYRSRRPESVVAEAASLFAQGVREINLVGQDTTSYGEDLGVKEGLAVLLARLASLPEARDNWIRFLYAYPNRVTGKLLETLAEHASLVKYIDLPLQHASVSVLKRMNRGSSGEAFLRLVERIRRVIPGVAIRTSMIVGFPGETEADFEQLCRFVEAARFEHLGVFSYSDEETSRSYGMESKVDRRTIYQRRRHLMSIQRRISRVHNRGLVGLETEVLVEGPSRETDLLWAARTPWQAPEIDGVCLINDCNGNPPQPGQTRRFRVTGAHDYDLVGTILEGSAGPAPMPFRVLARERP
jgi:ribosomal protein S12 methylthiotransferase